MDRSLLAVIAGTLTAILFTLLAGINLLTVDIRLWFIPLGFIIACLIIGVVGQLRVLHLVLISFILYLGLMVFLALSATLFVGLGFDPLQLDAIVEAWNAFRTIVDTSVPFLSTLTSIAIMLRDMAGGTSILAIFLEFFVAFLLIGIIGFIITGVSGHFTREPGLHVVSAPEPSIEVPPHAVPATTPPIGTEPAPAMAAAPPTAVQPPPAMEAPPPMPAPPAVEAAPPPPSKGGSPSAQAISSLKGKVTKHLKGTGQRVPSGQTRCPHCNATIIRGSTFCNACEKPI